MVPRYLFFQHASSLEPSSSGGIAYATLACLARVDLPAAVRRADDILADPESQSEEIVVAAAAIRCRFLSVPLNDEANRDLQDILRCAIANSLTNANTACGIATSRALYAMAVALACRCYQLQENVDVARRLFDERREESSR